MVQTEVVPENVSGEMVSPRLGRLGRDAQKDHRRWLGRYSTFLKCLLRSVCKEIPARYYYPSPRIKGS